MGLDITAYEKVELVRPSEKYDEDRDTEDYEAGLRFLYVEPSFPKHADGMVNGYYVPTGKQLRFRAGSYSGYNHFRAKLCIAAIGVEPEVVWADLDAYADKPFFELVHFSDCEGIIGPTTSAKLAEDFKDISVRDRLPEQGWWRESFDEWAKAFALAADTGVVEFH